MPYNKDPQLISIIRRALKEDTGRRDVTTELLIPEDKFIRAVLLAKEDGIVCGLDIAALTFRLKDSRVKFRPLVKDSRFIRKGKVLARIQGKAGPILTAERVALNFLSLLSGIATKTKKYVEAVKPYRVKIMDTRKTIPGLRSLEKYAVRIGGGFNHRFSLEEMILVKDNHIKVIGYRSLVLGIKKIRNKISAQTKIEVEVENLRDFKHMLQARPDIIMLDNMGIKDIKKAVQIRNGLSPNTYHLTPKLEASGGINLENIRKVAATGVDMISVGALTHSLRSIDISLEVI